MSYPGKMLSDGLCDAPTFEIPARKLMGTVCVCGGADCPLFSSSDDAAAILSRIKADPTTTIRLTTDADRISGTSAVTDHGLEVSQVLSGVPFAVAGAWGLNTDRSVISHGQQKLNELTIIDFSVGKSRAHETA